MYASSDGIMKTLHACHNKVIKDRLLKEVVLEPILTMEAEACAERFMWTFVRYHGWPKDIMSDRGGN